MKRIDREIQELWKKYQGDVGAMLQKKRSLEYFYALTPQRELLLEWYEFDPNGKLLQVGADYGAMTGLYSDMVGQVTVLDREEEALETVRMRCGSRQNVNCVKGSLEEYATDHGAAYDYVILMGSEGDNWECKFQWAKSLLKSHGVLIVAVSNPLGVKYLSGTAREEGSISQAQFRGLLGMDGFVRFYYPMPDYRTPISIYTDRWLPKKGDLTRVIPAYDYPEYHVTDPGALYDEVCEAGVFPEHANSYLVFWSQDGTKIHPQTNRIYMKYNKTRKETFQIRTCICESADKREHYVEKAALSLDGAAHIGAFKEKYQALKRQHQTLSAAEPKFSQQQNVVNFPYLEGKTWAESLGEEIQMGKPPLQAIEEALNRIYDLAPGTSGSFHVTDEFLEVFGMGLSQEGLERLEEDTSCQVSNIDALFENILATPEGDFLLDYEWVFFFPVPEHFVRYRILYYFYEQYSSLMQGVSLERLLQTFGITPGLRDLYGQMERNFQHYVHGANQDRYLGNYMVHSKGIKDMKQTESELARARERIEQMKLYAREKDVTIHKITEVQRLTNNHVTNLEAVIRDLRQEIDQMGKTLTYLNDHEAVLSKARRKLGDEFNRKYPKGSKERKLLQYRKEYFLHPVRSAKLYSSEEGKNLRSGDFHIGEIYKKHGRLQFEPVEDPVVSIVIPVYNQIHYTYACLVSILEHTKDVSYEVIIADDVSKDATEHLLEYARGLVICRNTTNQGFLRNCNQAARQARGKYLMFLNNDTQVTNGWLSSLVQLMESDSTIGMAGSKLVYPDGRLQEAGGIIWSDGSGWNYGRLDHPDKPEYNYVKDVDYISGAAILLPNELWKRIGGFDTRFAPAYCEDSDLAFEVRKAGYRVVYQPRSKVIHFEGISNGTDVEGSGLKRYQVVNSKKLKEKWAEEFAKQCENNGNPDPFRARERSQGKKIILVVDHYVPTYDKDAGSKTTFQYLKMFLKKGYVVKFLGDNFMREEPYTTALQQMGIEVLYGPEYQVGIWDWLRDHGDHIAVAYLNRPHIASKYVDYILEHTDIKVIYYGHDLHFLREMREYELTGDPGKREDAEYWRSVELSLMSKAAVSYYPSYIERDAILQIDPTISVKDITAYVFDTFRENIPQDFARREGLLFVGGFAHPPNVDAVLWFAKDIYPAIRERMGNQAPDFLVVGSKVTEEIKNLEQPGNGIVIKGFVTEEELEALYESCRLVVVPLRYGAGVKGKVVEAVYYGAPIVTTSIGAEGIPQSDSVMQIADQPEDFARAVADLYENPEACRSFSEKTQRYIRDYFSVDAAWRVIEEDFS